jgi:predicted O-methyltransferase YrrM
MDGDLKKLHILRKLGLRTLGLRTLLGFGTHKYLRKYIYPRISDFAEYQITSNVENLLFAITNKAPSDQYKGEFEGLKTELKSRMKNLKLNYPLDFAIEENTAFFLYSFIRIVKPLKLVETGVADGVSTYFILNAIKNNGQGKLYSIDISNDVGTLLSNNEKQNWELHILKSKGDFRKYLSKIFPFDIFIHDSNHSYFWQYYEYSTALEFITSNGFIMSDDVDYSYAFLDFCKRYNLKPYFIYDYRKIFGIIPLK